MHLVDKKYIMVQRLHGYVEFWVVHLFTGEMAWKECWRALQWHIVGKLNKLNKLYSIEYE